MAAYLLFHALAQTAPGGCGPGSACDRVLGSAWAYWLGVPVSAFALLAYGGLCVTSGRSRRARSARREVFAPLAAMALAVTIIGAALWFVGLQVFLLKSICKFCLTAHALGVFGAGIILVTTWRRGTTEALAGREAAAGRLRTAGVAAGLLAVGALIGGQFAFPKALNVVRVFDGRFEFDVRDVPLLGSPEAPQVIVSLFDYTCHDCHDLHKLLVQAQARYPNRFAIAAFPCPLDAQCNPLVRRTPPAHQRACEYARLGLAVRRAQAAAFARYDEWFFGQAGLPPLDEARAFARALVGETALEAAARDPWVERTLQMGLAMFRVNYELRGASRLPQLIIGKAVSSGPIRRAEDLFRLIEHDLVTERRP